MGLPSFSRREPAWWWQSHCLWSRFITLQFVSLLSRLHFSRKKKERERERVNHSSNLVAIQLYQVKRSLPFSVVILRQASMEVWILDTEKYKLLHGAIFFPLKKTVLINLAVSRPWKKLKICTDLKYTQEKYFILPRCGCCFVMEF